MEQDSNNKTPDTKNNKQKSNYSIIITCIALVFGLLGIGFGIYELIANLKKDEQISKLQEQISQLENASPQTINEKTRIKIISSSWSGWSEDYEPNETESYCEIELHKKCVVKTLQISDSKGNIREEEIFSFTITDINADSISIHTFQALSDSKNGIDLQSAKQDFTIKLNESLKLETLTMDAGDIFTITLSQE